MTANQVSQMTDKNLVVIPTKSMPQGISAMLGYDESMERIQNRETMCQRADGVTTMEITYAARNSSFDGLDIKAGEYLGLCDGRLMINHSDLEKIIGSVCEKIVESKKRTVSIYYGQEVAESEAEAFMQGLEEKINDPSIEINIYNGGQPIYYYIISAE